MELATRQCLLVIILALAVMAIPGGAADYVDVTGGDSVADCDQQRQWPSAANGTAFRGSLPPPLLAALPSATAPTGFASLRFGNGRAFARGLSYGEVPPSQDCRRCLSISLGQIDYLCTGSQRAGCFLAYADTTDASSWEDEGLFVSSSVGKGGLANYHPDLYDVQRLVDLAQSLVPRAANNTSGRMVATVDATQGNSTVQAFALCSGDVWAAECARCLERSVQDLAQGLQSMYKHDGVLSKGVGRVSYVFRYNCLLRLEISAPVRPMGGGASLRRKMTDHLAVVVVVVAVAIVVVVVGMEQLFSFSY